MNQIILPDTNWVCDIYDAKTKQPVCGVASPLCVTTAYEADKNQYRETRTTEGYYTSLPENYFSQIVGTNIAEFKKLVQELVETQRNAYRKLGTSRKILGHDEFPSHDMIDHSEIIDEEPRPRIKGTVWRGYQFMPF